MTWVLSNNGISKNYINLVDVVIGRIELPGRRFGCQRVHLVFPNGSHACRHIALERKLKILKKHIPYWLDVGNKICFLDSDVKLTKYCNITNSIY